MTNNEDARWCATGLLRMDTFTEYQRKHLLAAAAHLDRLVAENEAKDALLRQAVEALEPMLSAKLADGTYADKDCKITFAIAAIRQHLEGRA